MSKDWPTCSECLFSIWNVFCDCNVLALRARFLLSNMWIVATLPPLRTVVDLSHSVQLYFLCLPHHFSVIFSFHCILCCTITRQYPIIGLNKLPYYDIFLNRHACGCWLPPPDNISHKVKTSFNSNTMTYDRAHTACHIREISKLWVHLV
jgi:hypothetical protein